MNRFGALVAILSLVGCAASYPIVTGTTRSPIPPEQVLIYVKPPAEYEVVGLVAARVDTRTSSLDKATEKVKRQAANIGANGVLLVVPGATEHAWVRVTSVEGKAIFVQGSTAGGTEKLNSQSITCGSLANSFKKCLDAAVDAHPTH